MHNDDDNDANDKLLDNYKKEFGEDDEASNFIIFKSDINFINQTKDIFLFSSPYMNEDKNSVQMINHLSTFFANSIPPEEPMNKQKEMKKQLSNFYHQQSLLEPIHTSPIFDPTLSNLLFHSLLNKWDGEKEQRHRFYK